MTPRRIGRDDRPARHGFPRDGARRQRDGRARARGEVRSGVFGDQQRGEEAHHASPLDALKGGVRERDVGEFVAGREDDVVDGAGLGEEGFDILFHAGC